MSVPTTGSGPANTAATSSAPTTSAPPSTTGGATGSGPSSGSSAPTTGGSSTSSDWTSGLNEDLRGYVQNKGFKDPSAVVDSYRNLEKLHGVPPERMIKLPEKADDPAWNDIYGRLGRPQKADEYQLPIPKGDKGEFAKTTQEWFFEAGLSKKQAQQIAEKWNGYTKQLSEAQIAAHQKSLQDSESALKKEWGAAYDQNVTLAKRAMNTFGIAPEKIDQMEKIMGFHEVMKLMSSIGAKVGEDSLVTPNMRGSQFGIMTPEAARNRIRSLKSDPDFVRRYTAGETGAREEFTKLHQWANPESA